MPRMRGRLYSSCASSTWSFPSALVRVLGEDVEDQLRPVDDACVERVLERPLLRRLELAVDEQDFRPGVAVGLLQLLELALADVRPRVRARAVLDELADRLDACRARELAQLGELVLGVGRRGSTARTSPRSGSTPGLRFLARRHTDDYATLVDRWPPSRTGSPSGRSSS